MRSLPFLVLVGVLGTLLTACPGGGPGLSFTGTYSGTVSTREAAQLPEILRGLGGTFTVDLTQTDDAVTGTLNRVVRGIDSATISAVVSQPGVASGTFTATMRGGATDRTPMGNVVTDTLDRIPVARGIDSATVNLFLTPTQDLVLNFPTEGNQSFLFERQ